jgi:hypothetical protein
MDLIHILILEVSIKPIEAFKFWSKLDKMGEEKLYLSLNRPWRPIGL